VRIGIAKLRGGLLSFNMKMPAQLVLSKAAGRIATLRRAMQRWPAMMPLTLCSEPTNCVF
jgi:hypothetical protein